MSAKKKATKKVARKAGRPKKVVSEVIQPTVSEMEIPTETGSAALFPPRKTVYVLGAFPNPMWIRAVDNDGNKTIVRVPTKLKGKLIGQTITVEKIDGEDESYYKYAP